MLDQTQYPFFQLLVVDHDTHALPAEHVTRTNEHGITNLPCNFNSVICVVCCAIIRIWDLKFFEHITEPSAVFSNIHTVERCANDLYSFFIQAFSKFQCGLPTKLYDHAKWFFMLDDLPKMFPENGFKI